ncbi:ABC transporter permease [Candidatus Enterovibrio altilux]|nr:ABC transporter permease [Candidatus Enterovibrio luxaltus]
MIMSLQQIVQILLAHRLRSALAIIAIGWGIISILVLVALGEGFYLFNTQSLQMLISDSQMAFPNYTTKPWQGLPAGREITLSEREIRALEQHPSISGLSVIHGIWDAKVTDVRGRALPGYVSGIDYHFLALRNLHLTTASRGIYAVDQQKHAKIAVVGWQFAQVGRLSIGDTIKVNKIPFSIVGITKQQESGVSIYHENNQVMISSNTFNDLWKNKLQYFLVKPAEGIQAAVLRMHILSFFAKQKYFDSSDTEAINLPDLSDNFQFIHALFRGIQIFLGASGAMTLAVGTLGVANIMFLSVIERTREIGVCLAIGATKGVILRQFIFEGVLLVVLGTIIGILISYLIVMLLNYIGLPEWLGTPVITLPSLGWSLLVTTLFALLAAYFPAKRAANLTPVIALNARA